MKSSQKEELDNIENFLFDWILFVMWEVINSKQIEKRKIQEFLQKVKKLSIFAKHALTGDEAN